MEEGAGTMLHVAVDTRHRMTMTADDAESSGWTVVYNAVAAAGLLYPRFYVLWSRVVASEAIALSRPSVLVNTLRVRRFRCWPFCDA